MSLIEHYAAVKLVHLGMVGASGLLFALRGGAMLAHRAWPMRRPWRLASYAVDTLLLGAGITLWVMIAADPRRDAWLAVKLALLLLYIGLGSVALKRGRTPRSRKVAFVSALLVYLYMASVARAHHPLGLLAFWGAT